MRRWRPLNRLAVRLSLAIVAVALITMSLALFQVFLASRQFQQYPARVREPLERITEGYEAGEDMRALRPQFEALLEGFSQNPDELRALDARNTQVRWLTFGASVLLSVGVGVVLALALARRILRPISAVTEAASRLAAGDLSARASAPPPGAEDEGTVLARHFNRMADTLERSEGERRAMVADIAHELRTPLTIVQAQLDAMQDGVMPLDQAGLGELGRQVGRLSKLIDDLRTLSLADAERLTLERRELDFAAFAARVCESFRGRAQAAGLDLAVQGTDAPQTLCADPDRLEQVLANLLDNAVRYTEAGGWVRVSLAACGEGLELRVQDSGPALSEETLGRAFDRFYRAEASRSRSSGGSGLGLAIVRTLVELHGGSVGAFNSPDGSGGPTFFVTLPRALGGCP